MKQASVTGSDAVLCVLDMVLCLVSDVICHGQDVCELLHCM